MSVEYKEEIVVRPHSEQSQVKLQTVEIKTTTEVFSSLDAAIATTDAKGNYYFCADIVTTALGAFSGVSGAVMIAEGIRSKSLENISVGLNLLAASGLGVGIGRYMYNKESTSTDKYRELLEHRRAINRKPSEYISPKNFIGPATMF